MCWAASSSPSCISWCSRRLRGWPDARNAARARAGSQSRRRTTSRRPASIDMKVLGISAHYHDSAAALVIDGIPVCAVQEERLSRKKNDAAFPLKAIEWCLEQGKIQTSDLDAVVFYEKPMLKFERILTCALRAFPKSLQSFPKAMKNTLGEKLWIKGIIKSYLDVPASKILFTEHHQAHAAAAFLTQPTRKAAILTADGVGEWATLSIGVGERKDDGSTSIELLRELHFPHSLGMLYSTFTAFLGFEVNEGEYKVMGMAPYGVPRYQDKVWKLVEAGDDGAFALNLDYFSFHHSAERTYTSRFEQLFGAARSPETPFFTERSGYPSYFGPKPANWVQLAADNQHYADIAASIQVVTEEILLRMVRHACERAQTTKLCMAGGVALNSVANGRILRETAVTDLYVQPAAGDSGAALGAALFVAHHVLGLPRHFVMDHAYWGADLDQDRIRSTATTSGMRHV